MALNLEVVLNPRRLDEAVFIQPKSRVQLRAMFPERTNLTELGDAIGRNAAAGAGWCANFCAPLTPTRIHSLANAIQRGLV